MKQKTNKFSHGFTLLELLAVIAIIIIVSTVILISMMDSRTKAKNGRIQTNVEKIKVILETNFSPSGGFIDLKTCDGGPACGRNTSGPGDENITVLEEDIKKLQGSAEPQIKYFTIPYTADAAVNGYSIYAYFVNNGGYICYDSKGNNVVKTTADITIPEFPASNDACE